jgi:hypothetical protein
MHRRRELVKDFSLESLAWREIPVLDQLRKSRIILKFEENTRGANVPSHGGKLNSGNGSSTKQPQSRSPSRAVQINTEQSQTKSASSRADQAAAEHIRTSPFRSAPSLSAVDPCLS